MEPPSVKQGTVAAREISLYGRQNELVSPGFGLLFDQVAQLFLRHYLDDAKWGPLNNETRGRLRFHLRKMKDENMIMQFRILKNVNLLVIYEIAKTVLVESNRRRAFEQVLERADQILLTKGFSDKPLLQYLGSDKDGYEPKPLTNAKRLLRSKGVKCVRAYPSENRIEILGSYAFSLQKEWEKTVEEAENAIPTAKASRLPVFDIILNTEKSKMSPKSIHPEDVLVLQNLESLIELVHDWTEEKATEFVKNGQVRREGANDCERSDDSPISI